MDAVGSGKLAIGTRFFGTGPQVPKVIKRFVETSRMCAGIILVAVNTQADRIGTLDNTEIRGPGIEVFPVTPWGKFVIPLNTLVLKAISFGVNYFLSASTEMAFTRQQIQDLFNHMDEKTLVVGAALEGHNLQTGEVEGNGRTVPWNTFALWNLSYLARIGFPLIGDNPFDPENAGVEELTAIAVMQMLYPDLTAKLIAVPGIKWDIDDFNEERREQHEKKMRSKIERPAKQLLILNIPAPTIIHLP